MEGCGPFHAVHFQQDLPDQDPRLPPVLEPLSELPELTFFAIDLHYVDRFVLVTERGDDLAEGLEVPKISSLTEAPLVKIHTDILGQAGEVNFPCPPEAAEVKGVDLTVGDDFLDIFLELELPVAADAVDQAGFVPPIVRVVSKDPVGIADPFSAVPVREGPDLVRAGKFRLVGDCP
eukprot:CAMPEP_0201258058 /NCGR_PEP_ID=MMETSP0853-20130426/2268_1 /ASSEMBLY_ACC=CAM_ASM_000640 /TAXON_ID=183588 /ORGANISM="Pseudo-nitzschia fraudulenta, Strain WWA7" /LENGTH=176 /DNA_ID=CAMNT_0047559259 /DNA_START=738 /DNA_END=1268 /DNA_ORIENTATION=+